MKKFVSVFAIIFSAFFIFADESYIVKSVVGKVSYQSDADKWNDVVVGNEFSSETVVNTGLNSVLVLTDKSGNDIKIKPMQKDSIKNLSKISSSGGLKKTTITRNNVAEKSDGTSKGVSTAASRSLNAQPDEEWND